MGDRRHVIRDAGTTRDINVVVSRDEDKPGTISVVMLGTADGWSEVASIDDTDPGAFARACSLAEVVFDVLEIADATWT